MYVYVHKYNTYIDRVEGFKGCWGRGTGFGILGLGCGVCSETRNLLALRPSSPKPQLQSMTMVIELDEALKRWFSDLCLLWRS